MNKDQLKGSAKQAAGKVQEVAGRITGSRKQEAKGLAKQVAGKTRKAYGDVKEAVAAPAPAPKATRRPRVRLDH